MSMYKAVPKTDAEVSVAETAAPFDVEIQGQEAEDDPDPDVRVRVVAPCALPPGYVLPVRTRDGQAFDVRVPEGGVADGQAFETSRVPVKPVTGRFRDDLFGCGTEGCFCFVALCVPIIAIATIMESLRLDPCGGRSGSVSWRATFYVVAVVWAVWFVCYNINLWTTATVHTNANAFVLGIFYVTLAYMVLVATRTRWAFRQRYHIPGHCFFDCLASYFCNCCSALQMYRHMKASGERPMRFESTTEADLV